MPVIVKNNLGGLGKERTGDLLIHENKVMLKQNLEADDEHYYDRKNNVRLSFLADRIELDGIVYSLGDLLIDVGIVWFIIQNLILLVLDFT